MLQSEFLELYRERCLQMLDAYIQILKDNSNQECGYLFKLFDEHSGKISYK